MKTQTTPKTYLDSLVMLRGIAVIMVCFCHLGAPLLRGNPLSPLFTQFVEYGRYGVEIFFVISGFVIPLSLYRGNYTLPNYGQFIYKRFLRLQPPYLLGLLLTLLIMYLSSHVKNTHFPETTSSILASLFYFHLPAENPVFWSLAVEAQYYLFIGFIYAILAKHPKIFIYLILPFLLTINYLWISNPLSRLDYSLLKSVDYFLVGMIGFLIYAKIGKPILTYCALGILLSVVFYTSNLPAFIASFTTISIILFLRFRISAFWQFPGKISYSIYLLHFPVGIKLINLLKHKINPTHSWLLFTFALLVVFIVSWAFYKVVEEFSEQLSRSVKYTQIRTENFNLVLEN